MLQSLTPAVGRPLDRPAAASSAHLPQLDALRGSACLMVLVAHLKAVPPLDRLPLEVGTGSVGLFFVLSGFLITRILLADRAAGRGLVAFYNRRAARIFPIYYLTLAVLAVAWPGREVGWAAAFSFNLRSVAEARDYFAADAVGSPVAHFWSVCVEEHFYWLWPLAVRLLPVAVLRVLLAAIVAGTPLVAYLLADRLRALGFPPGDVGGLLSRATPTQLVALCLGGLFALHETALAPRGRIVGLGLIGVAAGWLLLPAGPLRDVTAGTALHLACGGGFLLAWTSRWFGRGWVFPAVGTVSYGLYLYHLPIFAALGLTDVATPAAPLTGGLAVLLTLALATVSYRFVERPILRRVRSGPPGRWRYTGVALTCGTVAAFAVSMAAGYADVTRRAGEVPAAPDERVAPVTGFGATVTTLVIGSSHAEMGIATPEFTDVAYNLGFSGQDAWYDAGLARYYLPRMPNLKRVVFAVDSLSLHTSVAFNPRLQWTQAAYFHVFGLRARTDDERLYNPVGLTATDVSRAAIAAMEGKKPLPDEPGRGWRGVPAAGPFDRDAGRRRAEGFAGRTVPPAENIGHLIAAVRLCQSRGVAGVIVTPPTHATYRDHLPPAFHADAAAGLQEILRATGVPHLDYEADPRFTEPDYFDADHLATAGAIKFSKILDADLNRVCPPPGR